MFKEQSPEREAVAGRLISCGIAARRWGQVVESLRTARNDLRRDAGDRAVVKLSEDQSRILIAAARQLGTFIGEAMKQKEEMERIAESAKGELYPPREPITDEQLLEVAARAEGKPACELTNIEGHALIFKDKEERRARRDATGCCGDVPDAEGICFGLGQCPRFFEAQRAERFVADYLKWIEQINEQSGLAAVAARLCVSSPVIESELSNV